MAFPATAGDQSSALQRAIGVASRLKTRATNVNNQMAAGNTSAEVVLAIRDDLINADNVFAEVAAVSGIAQYAKDQFDDQLYDVVADFNTMRTAIAAAIAAIETAFPSSGGFILKESLVASTSGTSIRTFTPAQTAGIRTALAAVISSIE